MNLLKTSICACSLVYIYADIHVLLGCILYGIREKVIFPYYLLFCSN